MVIYLCTISSKYLISMVFLIFTKFCSASFGLKSLILASDLTPKTDKQANVATTKNTLFHFIFSMFFLQARYFDNF